jgi:PAS domain S-box-containing protein
VTDAPPRIFIVEDEGIVADDLQQTLLGLGYQVAGKAKTGEAALEKIREHHPDLVLMDIHLAGRMDGIDAAGKVHREEGIPVIYLTAYADKQLLSRAKETEPYGYLIKPYDERGLQSAIEMALYKHRMEQRLRESEATTRLMVNATVDLLYLIGADGTFLMVNEALAERVNTAVEDLIGTSIYDLVAQKILTPRMACWQLDSHGERRLNFEDQLHRSWYDVTIYPVYDAVGGVKKYAVSVRNITAKKQAEEQTRNNAEYFRAVIEEASPVVVLLNPDGTFSQQSPSFLHALGYGKNDEPKKKLFDHLNLKDWQQANQVFSEVIIHPGMAKPVQLKFERKDGSICTIKGIMSNLSDNPLVGKIVMNGWVE